MARPLSLARTLVSAWLLASLATPLAAQEFRGQIAGRITDSSNAVLPGVTVTAANVDTGVETSATTNGEGIYLLPFLTPGKYSVAAELVGFKKLLREGVEVRIGDRLTVDLSLEVGQVAEVVSVKAESPLLDVASASQGQVIDEKRIALLPLSDGNPFTLARLAPGVAYTGDLKFSRAFDNGGTSGIVSDGASGGNEFTLDGTPNMASGRRVAFVPPAGAVSEFKVETAAFDAQQGHTSGANVNVTIKSGTNSLKGEGYWYYRDDKLSKNEYFLERQGRPKAEMSYDRFGGYAGGPVLKNRTFFFGAVEWLYDEFPEPGQFTVPTDKMRNGDFSELLSAGILIYDPATAVQRPDGRIERRPFSGNIIPGDRISPIAREYMKYWPTPNQAGNAQQQNNYISSNPRTDDFYSISLRGDHKLTDKQNIFVRFTRNDRQEARGNWAGEVNGIRPIGNYLYRVNDGVTGDHVWTMSPTSLLNVRVGWQRFQEPNVRQHEGEVDPASLGFSPTTASYFGPTDYLPRFEIAGMSVIGENVGGTSEHSIYSFQPTYTRVAGRHTLRAGYDMRLYKEFGAGPGRSAGQYDFGNNYTRQLDNSATTATGQQLASFLLGLPTGGSLERNAERLNYAPYHAFWFQDDWKISNRLTLNVGLRYDYEGATYDSDDRNVRGFDDGATLNITNAAQAAYARNPIPEIAPSAFNVTGGWLFAGNGGSGFWKTDTNNWQPRLGMAYQLNEKTVLRGGFGIYTSPFVIAGVRQPGFSQSTNIVPTLNNGLTFVANLANPWPNGVLDPVGSSLGVNTFVGRQLDRFSYVDGVSNQQNARWALTVQRELPGQWLVELGYVGSHGYDLTAEQNDNTLPRQYPEHRAGARQRQQQLPHGERDESLCRAAAWREPEWIDDAAPAAAAREPAVPGHPDVALRRHVGLPRVPEPRGEAVYEGLHGAVCVHLLEVQRRELHAELHRRCPARSRGRRRRPAPVRVLGDPRAAVRQGQEVGQRRQRLRQRADRRLDGHRDRVDPERTAAGLHRPRPQPVFQRRHERAEGRLLRRRGPAGVRRLRLLLQRRARADQRGGGPEQAAGRSADCAGQQRPLLPAPAGESAASGAERVADVVREARQHHRAHPRAGEHRAAERVQPDDLQPA